MDVVAGMISHDPMDHAAETAAQARQVLLDEGYSEVDLEALVRHQHDLELAQARADRIDPLTLEAAVLLVLARSVIDGDHAPVRLMIARAARESPRAG